MVKFSIISLVTLAGTGHARKGRTPRQMVTLGDVPYQVVLPGIPSILEPATVSSKDADFLLLGL